MTPVWVKKALTYSGLKEIKGIGHNPQILDWWQRIKAPFRDDETPWCAGFVGGVLEECGIASTRSAAARGYLKWGVEIYEPVLGAIVVFWRGNPKSSAGHVGFVMGKDRYGHIMVLGGNQGDMVSIRPFDTSRVLSYRWPKGHAVSGELPLLASNGILSTNEA